MKDIGKFTSVMCASLALAVLPGCGKTTDGSAAGDRPQAASGDASAEQVAREARGRVKCPAGVATPAPAGPATDVVGIRPGQTYEEAANQVLCDNPLLIVREVKDRGFNIETYGAPVRQAFVGAFAEPRVAKSSEEIVKDMQDAAMRRGLNTYVAPLKPGQSRYFVSTMGTPGQERVIAVSREEYFPEGKLPSVGSVKQALITKYGPPSQVQDNGTHSYLWWETDPAGRPIPEGTPLHMHCRINVSPDAPVSLNPECGAQVGALVTGSEQNPGLAHSLAVTSQNGARGNDLVFATEAALQRADAERQAKEVNAAAKGAAAPRL